MENGAGNYTERRDPGWFLYSSVFVPEFIYKSFSRTREAVSDACRLYDRFLERCIRPMYCDNRR